MLVKAAIDKTVAACDKENYFATSTSVETNMVLSLQSESKIDQKEIMPFLRLRVMCFCIGCEHSESTSI